MWLGFWIPQIKHYCRYVLQDTVLCTTPKGPRPQLLLDHIGDPHQDRIQALNVYNSTEDVRAAFSPHEDVFQTTHISLQGHEQYQTAKVSSLVDHMTESVTQWTKMVEETNDRSLQKQEQTVNSQIQSSSGEAELYCKRGNLQVPLISHWLVTVAALLAQHQNLSIPSYLYVSSICTKKALHHWDSKTCMLLNFKSNNFMDFLVDSFSRPEEVKCIKLTCKMKEYDWILECPF